MTKLSNYITANQSLTMKLKCFVEHYVPHHNQALWLELTKCYEVSVLSWLLMLIYQNDKIYLSSEPVTVLSSIKCAAFNHACIKCVNFRKTQYWLETVLIYCTRFLLNFYYHTYLASGYSLFLNERCDTNALRDKHDHWLALLIHYKQAYAYPFPSSAQTCALRANVVLRN